MGKFCGSQQFHIILSFQLVIPYFNLRKNTNQNLTSPEARDEDFSPDDGLEASLAGLGIV
jgi:hypothetical protein